MPAVLIRPAGGSGPGLVVLQEIFGVSEYIKQRARDLAAMGYLVLVPELYWRFGQSVTTDETSEAGPQEAFGYFSQLDIPQAADDSVAALEHLRGLPDSGGRAGVLGFCLGGRLAYLVGVQAEPDVVVSYYGSGIAERMEDAPKLTAPVLFHFGGSDPYFPMDQIEQVQQAFADRSDAEVHVQPDAGHAFDNFRAPIFHHPAASAASWPLTQAFLRRYFPTAD
jgi:carboxymethylenebutenolidase